MSFKESDEVDLQSLRDSIKINELPMSGESLDMRIDKNKGLPFLEPRFDVNSFFRSQSAVKKLEMS